MSYYFSKKSALGFEEAIEKVTEALKSEGFGVLAEIDVKETLKKKLNVDFRPYKILLRKFTTDYWLNNGLIYLFSGNLSS